MKTINNIRGQIPEFIIEKIQSGEKSGSIDASVHIIDISGFTALTEILMKKGVEGAEILTRIINNIFNPVIDIIYVSGGFVSDFAGDALAALYPAEFDKAIYSSIKIKDTFSKKKIQETKSSQAG